MSFYNKGIPLACVLCFDDILRDIDMVGDFIVSLYLEDYREIATTILSMSRWYKGCFGDNFEPFAPFFSLKV